MNELTPYQPTPLSERHRWVSLLTEVATLAHQIANTNFVPKNMKGDEAAVTAAILYGDEVGLPPMTALSQIAIIEGRPALAAQAQRALILAAGHELWVEENTTTRVTWAGRRKGSQTIQRVTWTADDARRSKLDGKDNWRRYPRQMLSARASADLARAAFADVIGGLSAVEEFEGEQIVEDGQPAAEPAAAEPEGRTVRRKRAPRKLPVVAPPTAPQAEEQTLPPLPDEQAPEEQQRPPDSPVSPEEAQRPQEPTGAAELPTEPAAEQEEARVPGPHGELRPRASQMAINQILSMMHMRGIDNREARQTWIREKLGITKGAGELSDREAQQIIEALAQEPLSEQDETL